MFRGNLPAKIDAQGRMKIPSAHRRTLDMNYGDQIYVTSVTGQNVLVYPMHEWEDMEARLLEPPKLLPGKLKFLRNTSYYGQVVKVDRQSRILIPVRLREAAGIDAKEVDVMGQLNYLEIWNRERFQEVLEKDPYTEVDALALAEIGI